MGLVARPRAVAYKSILYIYTQQFNTNPSIRRATHNTTFTMAPRNTPSTAPKPPLKILMLHGYTQSGLLFRGKTGALTKAITKAFPLHEVSFSYPTGPLRLNPSDIPGYNINNNQDVEDGDAGDDEDSRIAAYGWWIRASSTVPNVEYKGIDNGFRAVAQVLRDEGPFDGIIGFSQGASLAFAVTSLLEPGRREMFAAQQKDFFPESFLPQHINNHPPLKFGIVYSGFRFADDRFRAIYDKPVQTPVLHVLGSLDALVSEARSRDLIEACAGATTEEMERRVVFHPGGHFVPSQKKFLEIAVGFMRSALEGNPGDKEEEEESVEDMDVPF